MTSTRVPNVCRGDESIILDFHQTAETRSAVIGSLRRTCHETSWNGRQLKSRTYVQYGGGWESSTMAKRIVILYDKISEIVVPLSHTFDVQAVILTRRISGRNEFSVETESISWKDTMPSGEIRARGLLTSISELDSFALPVSPITNQVAVAPQSMWHKYPIVLDGTAAGIVFHEIVAHSSEWSGWETGSSYWPITFDAHVSGLLGRLQDDMGENVKNTQIVDAGRLVAKPVAGQECGASWWAAPHESTARPRFLVVTISPEIVDEWPVNYVLITELANAEFIAGVITFQIASAFLYIDGIRTFAMPRIECFMCRSQFIDARFVPRHNESSIGWCVRNGSWLPTTIVSPSICIHRLLPACVQT